MAEPSQHIDDDQLALLMDGALPEERVLALEDHVDQCVACNELLIRVAQQVAPGDVPANNKRTIGRYQISSKLGAGGMGVVYAAYDPTLRRDVALKLIRPDSGDDAMDKQRADRLLREAHALAALSHPNIVSVFDAGTVDGQLFIATELVKGRTVTQWVLDEAPELEAITDVYGQVAAALAAAHAAGIVHRDVKPDNILIGDDGRVRLVDFGLATQGAGARQRVRALASTVTARPDGGMDGGMDDGEPPIFAKGSNEALTVSGAVMGTPLYMSPEQLVGPTSDPRADQFAFCVSLYESRYRKRPFAGKTLAELAENAMAGNVRQVELATQPAKRLHAIILRGMSADADDRYDSMNNLATALASVTGTARPRSSTRQRSNTGLWLAVGAVVVAVAGVLLLWQPAASTSTSTPASTNTSTPTSTRTRTPTSTSTRTPTSTPTSTSTRTSTPTRTKPPAPPNTTAIAASARLLSKASRMINTRDSNCRAALRNAANLGVKPLFDTTAISARCDMINGACASGIVKARTFAESKGVGSQAAQTDAQREALMFCPTSQGTWQQRLARMQRQVHIARTSGRLSQRYRRDLVSLVQTGRTAMTSTDRITVYNITRTLAQALARFSDCSRARAILKLGVELYLGPGRPLWAGAIPLSPALKSCIAAATP